MEGLSVGRHENPPEALVVDEDQFVMRCIDDYMIDESDEYHPYVDVRIDTIPPRTGDLDFSERPDLLRQTAAWLVKAADWLEKKQREFEAAATEGL